MMNENELKNFKNFVELKLRECFNSFDREFIKWSPDSFADIIARDVHREYQIKQKWDEDRFILVPHDERVPVCHGCFNEFGRCGTPCVGCVNIERFNVKWDLIMMVPDKYNIYERRSL